MTDLSDVKLNFTKRHLHIFPTLDWRLEQIRSGQKSVVVLFVTEKTRPIAVGDHFRYVCKDQTVNVEVVRIARYTNADECYAHEDVGKVYPGMTERPCDQFFDIARRHDKVMAVEIKVLD